MNVSCAGWMAGLFLCMAACEWTSAMNGATDRWLAETREQGVRAAWVYTYPPGHEHRNMVGNLHERVGELKAHGLNMLCVGCRMLRDATPAADAAEERYYDSLNESFAETLQKVIRAATEENIAVLVMFITYDDPYVELLDGREYRRAMDMQGVRGSRLACPSDMSFWKGMEIPRTEQVAEWLREAGAVGGILLEAEAYCARTFYPGYSSQKTQFCYCDHCFRGYLEEVDLEEEVGKQGELPQSAERYAWLCRRGLDGAYETYMTDVYAAAYRLLFDRARQIYPETLAGLYQLGVEPHSHGFVKGVAHEQLPTLLFANGEYFTGYDRPDVRGFANIARSSDLQSRFAQWNLNTWYLGGVIPGAHWPRQYAAELGLLLRYTDGYWIYDGSTLLRPAAQVLTKNPRNRNDFFLRAYPQAYLTEISRVNQISPRRPTMNSLRSATAPVGGVFQREGSDTPLADKETVDVAWSCDGVEPECRNGVYSFPADGPVAGRRTRYIVGKLKKDDVEIGATYGLTVRAANRDATKSRWISLGWSHDPPFPVFYDTNILLHPGVKESYSFVFTTKEDWDTYWVRVGVRCGEAPISIGPLGVLRLGEVRYRSDAIELPDAEVIRLEASGSGDDTFPLRYDVLPEVGEKPLMVDCTQRTDIGVLRNLGIRKTRIQLRMLTTAKSEKSECPELQWAILRNGVIK